jgi:poly(3-hydroxybutyrate) depolymerase
MKQIFTLLTLIIGFNGISQQTFENIDISGSNREYYKYLPTNFDATTESLPLVIIMHGIGGTALQLTGGQYNLTADTARFIPVYLQGKLNAYNQTSWNNGTLLGSTEDDVLFISHIIDQMKQSHDIDLSRVYVTGISMGSIMTYKAMRHLDDRIAAVSCHIGTMSTEEITDYAPTHVIPVQHIHGTLDTTVPYDSAPFPSLSLVPETITKLKTVNGWNGDSTVTAIPDIVADGITIDKIVYDCATPLEFWRMNDAAHIFLLPGINDVSGVHVSWEFFYRFSHSNPSPSSASIANKTTEFNVEFYPNPATDKLFIKRFHNLESISIFDVNGKIVLTETNVSELLDVNSLSNGIYSIKATNLDGLTTIEKLVISK